MENHCLRPRMGEKLTVRRNEESFGNDGKVLYLDWDGGCMCMHTCERDFHSLLFTRNVRMYLSPDRFLFYVFCQFDQY